MKQGFAIIFRYIILVHYLQLLEQYLLNRNVRLLQILLHVLCFLVFRSPE